MWDGVDFFTMTDEKTLLEYFRKSFFAVDGLWFVKLEEEFGFDKALEIDKKVWEILPKIQVRHLRKVTGVEGNGIGPYLKIIKVRLEGEGYDYTIDEDAGEIRFSGCPWHEIMINAGREHLSGKVGEAICVTEHRVWAQEFGLVAALDERFCTGAKECVLKIK
jgi:hypothetical protein